MNRYIILGFIVLIITSVSFIVEFIYPIITPGKYRQYILNFIYRFIHFFMFIYFSTFILLFKYTTTDTYIYLFAVIFLFYSWHIAECCILTYYELQTYNVDHNQYDTTFHPTMKSIFRDYADTIMIIIGILITISVIYIFIHNNISLYFKIPYAIIYIYLLGDSFFKSRLGKKQYYPTTSDSFFKRYIHL